ncbi:MAG TPA: hypothetical protein VF498_08165 [Anaerolineales bacterium]
MAELITKVDGLENTLGPGQGGLDGVVQVGKLAQGLDEVLPVVDEGRDDAHADQALQRQPAAEPRQDDHEEVAQHIRQRH